MLGSGLESFWHALYKYEYSKNMHHFLLGLLTNTILESISHHSYESDFEELIYDILYGFDFL